ncbi:hypothetical protein GCM10008967_15770 [Bacillus carboniphilus]|uniref:Uncharacterized protein n=1 Tax=Bacillus carboniphilus TaxID=86663 RepID=A0ABP3FTZ7_9BACI
MGLFINKKSHPEVYKNKNNIKAPNQDMVHYNYITELIKEQQRTNKALAESLAEIKQQYVVQDAKQTQHWNHVKDQMDDLIIRDTQREEFENAMMERLDELDDKNLELQKILENESVIKQTIMDHINHLSESNKEIADRLEKSEAINQFLKHKLNQQYTLQKEVAETLSNTKEFQSGVLERLDHQEAVTEKISRQLNHIRSIIFERTNYLATKIEDGYQITSNYVYKLMTGSDQPLTFSLLNQKKKEETKQASSSK